MRRIWQRLSKRERSLVILTALVLLLVLGRYLVLSPFLERREWVKNQLELQPHLLERNLRYLNQKAEIAGSLERVRGELKALELSLLAGSTPSLSASELQQAVQALAAQEGVQVISTRVLSPQAMGSFTRIPIQIEFSGQIDQVINFLKEIESAEKLLVLDELILRSLLTRVAPRPQRQLPVQVTVRSLRASLILSGFSRNRPPSPAESQASSTTER